MRLAWFFLLLLAICLAIGSGCGRKKRGSGSGPWTFTPEAIQQVADAEKTPQASLELLNETLKDWVLRKSSYPKDPQEFITAGMLPRLPNPPPGKKFAIDAQHVRVVLANE